MIFRACGCSGGAARRWRLFAAWAAVLWLSYFPASIQAEGIFPLGFNNERGSSTWFARREASRRLPLTRLDANERARVKEVLSRLSVYRRLPTQNIECEPELYQFLLRNPEVVVNMWRLMGVTQVDLVRTGETTFLGDDGAGTTCDIEVLHQDARQTVLFATGEYSGALAKKPLYGDCVLLLTSEYDHTAVGSTKISVRLDAFIHLHQFGVELIAKTLHPVLGRIADHNFTETIAFLGEVSRTSENNPEGMMRLADQTPNLSDDVRREFQQAVLQAAGTLDDEDAELIQAALHAEPLAAGG